MKSKQRILSLLLGALLFFLFAFRFYLASTMKPFWTDESVGLSAALGRTYSTLLLHGSGEASGSPLFYLLNKILYGIFDNHPQYWWDLRFFNRFLPATYWALANTYVFFWTAARARTLMRVSFFPSLLLGAAAAFFLHSCSFMDLYAIEDRGYPLWVSLSTVQFLAWCDLLLEENPGAWWRYGIFSVLLSFTTFSALGQVGFGCLLLLAWSFWGPQRWHYFKRVLMVGVASVSIAMPYFLQTPNMNYGAKFEWPYFFETVGEVISKVFHHHSSSALWGTLPLLLLFLPFLYRRDKKYLWLVAYNFSMLFLTVVFFKGSEWKGGIWASRYVTFLIPSFFVLYCAGLLAIANLIGRWRRIRLHPLHVLLIWSAIQVFTLGKSYVKSVSNDWHLIRDRNVYGLTLSKDCPDVITQFESEFFNKMNEGCRRR